MSAPRPLAELARDLDLDPTHRAYLPYGHDFAKIDTIGAGPGTHAGKLVVVSAVTPTPLGEGKTVTSISLAMGMNRIGARTIVCLPRGRGLPPRSAARCARRDRLRRIPDPDRAGA